MKENLRLSFNLTNYPSIVHSLAWRNFRINADDERKLRRSFSFWMTSFNSFLRKTKEKATKSIVIAMQNNKIFFWSNRETLFLLSFDINERGPLRANVPKINKNVKLVQPALAKIFEEIFSSHRSRRWKRFTWHKISLIVLRVFRKQPHMDSRWQSTRLSFERILWS